MDQAPRNGWGTYSRHPAHVSIDMICLSTNWQECLRTWASTTSRRHESKMDPHSANLIWLFGILKDMLYWMSKYPPTATELQTKDTTKRLRNTQLTKSTGMSPSSQDTSRSSPPSQPTGGGSLRLCQQVTCFYLDLKKHSLNSSQLSPSSRVLSSIDTS